MSTTVLCAADVNDKRPSVYWDQKSQDVRQGDNVTMTCTVTGVMPLDVVRLTHDVTADNYTSSSSSMSATSSSLVADNDVVKEAFSALGRYRVLYHVINDSATLQLRIRGMCDHISHISLPLFPPLSHSLGVGLSLCVFLVSV